MSGLYFDYQATTPVADDVLHSMQPYFAEIFGNPHSTDHSQGWKSSAAVEVAAQQVADHIGSGVDEILFTSGATESNNLAILGIAKRAVLLGLPQRRILVSAIEHKSVLSASRVLEEQYGFAIDVIPVDSNGHIIFSELERLLGQDVLLVSIMAVNNEIGTIQDIVRLSEVIKGHGALFHCDAAQAPFAIDMSRLANEVDLLSISGHKMYGPKGIGALYVRRDLQDKIEPLIYGGGQQNGLRSGTLPTPLVVGLGAAARYIGSQDVMGMRDALSARRDRFFNQLMSLHWPARLFGSVGPARHPGNLAIGFEGIDARDLLGVLQPHLAASTGSACISGMQESSHVLKAIGLTSGQAETVIRFSLGYETSDAMVDEAVRLIKQALQRLSES